VTASEPFQYLMRVRYGECDAQGIVFNARWGEYVDLAASEYTRSLFGSTDPIATDFDCRLVKQTMQWKTPARFDDVLELRVRTTHLGTTSYTTVTEIFRHPDRTPLAECETVYVCVLHNTGTKRVIPDRHRRLLEVGAPGVIVDHAGALPRA
jgi:acyl-CoA thioester hydrolase